MIENNHPFNYLSEMFHEKDSILYFSKYLYKADSLFDEREIIEVASGKINQQWVEQEIVNLRDDHELALHSKIKLKGKTYHIPMIDFSYENDITEDVFDRLRMFIPKKIFLNLSLFKSGRSFHAYSTTLLTPKEWIEFMGRLLLINSNNDRSIIDSRWIGHRLIGGYSSLRWSNNTNHYLAMPTKLEHMFRR